MKKGLVFLVVIVIAVAILFFSLFWPLNNEENLQGTIGGVEKADKFRGEQPVTEDVLLEDEDFAALTQSAEWQNSMKDEEFVAFLKSEEFQRSCLLLNDMKNLVLMKNCFDVAKNTAPQSQEISDEELKLIQANDFQSVIWTWSHDFQKFLFSQDDPQSVTFAEAARLVILNSQDFDTNKLFSSDMQKFISSEDFEKYVYSQDFQKVIVSLGQDFQNLVLSGDFQNTLAAFNQDFQKRLLSVDFQKAVFSQDHQKMFYTGSDVQKAFFLSQDMQNVFASSNVQALLNIQFKSIMSAEYQQSFMSALVLNVGNW